MDTTHQLSNGQSVIIDHFDQANEHQSNASTLSQEYNTLSKSFLTAPYYGAFNTVLEQAITRLPAGTQIRKAIIFGSGSPSGALSFLNPQDPKDQTMIDEIRSVALYQLAILQSCANVIGQKQRTTVQLFAQEPAFNQTDLTFLPNTLNIQIPKPNPDALTAGYHLIDQSTFVYAPGAEQLVLAAICDAKPLLLLGPQMPVQSGMHQIQQRQDAEARFLNTVESITCPPSSGTAIQKDAWQDCFLYIQKASAATGAQSSSSVAGMASAATQSTNRLPVFPAPVPKP